MVMTRESVMLMSFLNKMESEGFILDEHTLEKMKESFFKEELSMYFRVSRNGRTDEEIDRLARQHKVELIVMTGLPNVHLKYRII